VIFGRASQQFGCSVRGKIHGGAIRGHSRQQPGRNELVFARLPQGELQNAFGDFLRRFARGDLGNELALIVPDECT
jgi:hypothetical protein